MPSGNSHRQITPHLWFDREAQEAAEFYVSVFGDAAIENVTALHDTPSSYNQIWCTAKI